MLWTAALIVPLAIEVALLGTVWNDPDEGVSFWLVGEVFVAVQGAVTLGAANAEVRCGSGGAHPSPHAEAQSGQWAPSCADLGALPSSWSFDRRADFTTTVADSADRASSQRVSGSRAGSSTCWTMVALLGAAVAVPWNTAVIVCVPTDSDDVVNTARPAYERDDGKHGFTVADRHRPAVRRWRCSGHG